MAGKIVGRRRMTAAERQFSTLRETIQFYLVDCQSPLGKLIDIIIVILNLAVCVLYVIDTYPISDATRDLLWRLEIIAVFFFIIEYIARLYGAKNRLKYVISLYSIIDLIAILPILPLLVLPLFGWEVDLKFVYIVRVFRIFRVFRFIRFTADPDFFFGRITPAVLRLFRLILTILIIFFVSSGLFFQVEHTVNAKIDTFGDAFYFTVVTLTTVGFGDITPVSQGGRWVTTLMILSGIILIPWQVGQLIKEWLRISNKMDVVCPKCGLKYHDRDASHCKACGHVIYQEFEGD